MAWRNSHKLAAVAGWLTFFGESEIKPLLLWQRCHQVFVKMPNVWDGAMEVGKFDEARSGCIQLRCRPDGQVCLLLGQVWQTVKILRLFNPMFNMVQLLQTAYLGQHPMVHLAVDFRTY